MQLTRYGHSCVLVETGGQRLLIDPGNLSDAWHGLQDLDAVLVTHQHPDHLDVGHLPALLAANPRARVVTEPEVAARLADGAAGDALDVRALAAGETHQMGSVTVEAVGGTHATIHEDVPLVGNVGLLVRADGEPVLLHPGDSYAATPSGVDVLAVPLMAPWAALKEMVDFSRAVGAGVTVPIHDGLLVPGAQAMFRDRLADLGGSRFVDLPTGERVAV